MAKKLMGQGKLQQGVMRTMGVPSSVTVKSPKRLSTATDMNVSKPGMGTMNPASKLRGPMTHGKSGGVIIGK